MITSEQLKPYFINHNKWSTKKVLQDFTYSDIYYSTSHILPIITDKDFKERIYIILYNIIEIPTCKLCGKKVNFHSISKGYYQYCSLKCSSKDTSENRVESIRKSQGENAFKIKTPLTKERQQIANDRRKQTTLDRYGVESYMQTPEFRQSISNAAMEQYGVEYFTRAKEVQEQTKQTCIERYGYENQMQSSIIQQKSKDTCLEKYGYEHASQAPEVWKKGMDTKFENHGYYSPFQLECVQEKSKQSILKKYGVPNAFHIRRENRSCHSKISQECFWSIYKELNSELQKQCYFGELNREYIMYYQQWNKQKYFFLDFCIIDKKIVIEFQGDHWHKNPKFYEATEENIKIWEKDEYRRRVIEGLGFKLFYIWEDDYRNNKEVTINNILEIINTNK